MKKHNPISFTKRLILLLLGATMICFAVSPKSYALNKIDVEKQAKEIHDDGENKGTLDYYVAYEAIVPVIQFHLYNDLAFVFDLFVLEENEQEQVVEVPIFVNHHKKILFSRIISPNAP